MSCLTSPAVGLLVGIAIGCVTPAAASAQQVPASHPTRVPVTVIRVDSVAGGAPYAIVRRTDSAPFDVLLLPHDATPATFSAAVSGLMITRAATGDTARTGGIVRVRRTGERSHGADGPVFPWAARVLHDLQGASPQAIPGIGTYPAVEIWLPPQRPRARRTSGSG